MTDKRKNPSPRTFYPGNHREAALLDALLPALAAALCMSESGVIRYAIRELADIEASMPGGGEIGAILTKYDNESEGM